MTLDVVHARGTHRALGRAQGEAFGGAIQSTCGFYRRVAAAKGGDFDALGAAALPYLDAARTRTPELVDELVGLVEGAGITLEAGLALNCMEEVWDLDSCTTMVHGSFFMHAEQWYAGHSSIGVVVAEPEDGPTFVSPTCVGFLPAVGMSAAGFAQGIDSLTADDERVGVPRVIVSRLALGAPGFAAAIAAACTSGRAGGYAHVLATPQQCVAVETSATRHAVMEGAGAHTNHYLSEELAGLWGRGSDGSRVRLARARELLEHAPPSSLEDCTRLLSDHGDGAESICHHEDGGFDAVGTVFGMACDLVTGRVLVSDGPPCRGKWEDLAVPTSLAARRVG
jgi:isopenicillin-N N-acyltransferase-like protein